MRAALLSRACPSLARTSRSTLVTIHTMAADRAGRLNETSSATRIMHSHTHSVMSQP